MIERRHAVRHFATTWAALALVAAGFAMVGSVAAAPARQEKLPAEMIGVTWQLAAFQQGGKAVDVGTGLTLVFTTDGHVSGEGGCTASAATTPQAPTGSSPSVRSTQR